MAFDTVETSEYFEPIELYEFIRGPVNWTMTSYGEDVVYNFDTYDSIPIERSPIDATQDVGKGSIKIKIGRRSEFLTQFIASSPTDVISLTITRLHASDSDTAVIWKGRVINVSFEENLAIVTCASIQSSLRRPGLRRLYQLGCPHALYGDQCGLIRDLFDVPATISAISGLEITSSAFIVSINPTFDASHFKGGYVEFDQSGVKTRRFITDHNNATGVLTLNISFQDLVVTDNVIAYPGCSRTTGTCAGKFSNINNFGGFPFIPIKNPMDGTPVF